VIKVLVVDDSAVICRLVSLAIGGDPGIEVIGTAGNGKRAIQMVDELQPDAIILDVEMPELDGLAALEVIRKRHPKLPIIMFSTITEKGAAKTLQALSLGASDYVTKPSHVGGIDDSVQTMRDELVPRIKALCGLRAVVAAPSRKPAAGSRFLARVDVLAFGCSTGGPDALAAVISSLPANLPVPVLVVQHMPPVFTKMFAERLQKNSALTVREAVDGEALVPGHVMVAPGDFHLRVARDRGARRAVLDQGAKENYCRPAVDVLFRSVSEVYGRHSLGVVLTGMGQDGLIGCEQLRKSGSEVVVQDQETSVVWGMPGVVASAGLANHVVPLTEIGFRINQSLRRGR
jgi:two-component system chemotaxis response regulator CheB